jgi:hypothetical protein
MVYSNKFVSLYILDAKIKQHTPLYISVTLKIMLIALIQINLYISAPDY